MKAVLFSARHGQVSVEDIPDPLLVPGSVLVRNEHSLISAGTERARVVTGHESLLGKARRRPDQVRQVLRSLSESGPLETLRLVNDQLDAPSFMGYSSAGVALEVGEGVDDVRPGSLVAAAGGGYANHAEVVCVPRNLCVPVPEGLSSRWAAFATVAAIALQGIHQAAAEPGSRVAVIGLGLVGQLTVRLLEAYGFDTLGVDRDPDMVELARESGVRAVVRGDDDGSRLPPAAWRGTGADAVLLTAATTSADPVQVAGQLARDRATVVVVGDVLVVPPRPTYYGKELCIRYSRSYGPGRYDPVYEEGGLDYPAGYVPWTERRNLEEVLRLMAKGSLDIDSLQPAVFPVEQAAEAYDRLAAKAEGRRVAAILLSYPPGPLARPVLRSGTARHPSAGRHPSAAGAALRSVPTRARRPDTVRVAAVGAGSFGTRMLLPPLRRDARVELAWITTASGLSASRQGKRWRFERTVGGVQEGLGADDSDCVLVLTRHDTHARYAAEILRRGIGLFCEKPVALDEEELESVADAWLAGGGPAMVGFNRRFAPAVRRLKVALEGHGPFQVVYRVFAGRLAPGHWYHDPAQGGRLLGEVCHFLDTASHLVGSVPASVTAKAGDGCRDATRAQSVTLLVEYHDGSTASIVYGGLTPPGAPKELIEVSGDRLAATIDDFGSLRLWTGRASRESFRGRPKGHAEEMRALVDLLQGRPDPAADFRAALWTSLAVCRAAAALASGRPSGVEPASPALGQALGTASPVRDLQPVRP